MCTVIWLDWPWPSLALAPPAPPRPPAPSQRPDKAPVSHPDPSVPQNEKALDRSGAFVGRST